MAEEVGFCAFASGDKFEKSVFVDIVHALFRILKDELNGRILIFH